MLPFVAARLIQSIPLAFGASIIVFVIMRLIPGDPAVVYAGPEAPDEVVEAVREEFGLNKPLPVQYGIWISKVLQGDLGFSYLSKLPVIDLLGQRIPATLQLTIAAMLLTICIAIPAGVLAALRSGGPIDMAITSAAGISVAVPSFWLGILAIYLFAQQLGWLPPGGRSDASLFSDPVEVFKYLLLPALTLSSATSATLSRVTKSAMLEVLYEDYVRTANAKGLKESQVVIRHVLRNAMVPVVTVAALQIGFLLGGAVVIESVFAWPGVGRLILAGLSNRDYSVVQGALLSLIFVFIIVNLVTDILYGFLDPRIRVGARASAN
jgi:peptide/nickel transport system permease protein